MGNIIRTTLLLAFLTGLLVIVGRIIGGVTGMIFAFIIAIVMNLGSYWYSDKIVLKMYRAKEVTPQEAPEIHRIVENLTLTAKIPMPKVYIVQSETPNAFATGRDPKHAAVAVTTGILKLLNSDELEGVLGHELTHVKNRDTLISAVAATIAGVITMLASWATWIAIFGGFGGRNGDRGSSDFLGIILMAILAPIAAMIIQMAISRTREYSADEGGAKMSRKPWALASALKKLETGVARNPMKNANPSTAHMFIINPFKNVSMAKLFTTHPPTEERIKRLKKMFY
ncbi:MAG TPA: zinc metalloprotease HtpX [Euryarchaeota archaeon]|nr:zinc metalloprotease HtpX [Euryarchaeota archaeon]